MGFSGTESGRSLCAICGGNDASDLGLLVVSGSADMGKRICLRDLFPTGLKGAGTDRLRGNFNRAAAVCYHHGLLADRVVRHILRAISAAVMPG